MLAEAGHESYARDGVICLRGVFRREWLDAVRDGIDAVLEHPGEMSYVERDASGKPTYVSEMFPWVTSPSLRRFIFESPAAQIAASAMRTPRVNLLYDQAFLRLAGSPRRTEWHNDMGYWPVRGDLLCTMWIPLQATTMNDGGVEYVLGSHRWAPMYKDQLFHVHREFDLGRSDREPGFIRPCPPIEGNREQYAIARFDLEPGDCLVHHPLVLHAAPPSATGMRRLAYSLSLAGHDVRFAPRLDTHRLIFDPGLNPGDPLDSELFPRLWG